MMTFKRLEEDEWLSFLHKCKSSTFFHTPHWYRVWHTYKGYQYEARLFTFSDGQEIIFPLAWRTRFKGFFKELLSGPAGVYGGPLSPAPICEEKFTLIWLRLREDFDVLHVRLCPYQEVQLGQNIYKREDFTQRLLIEHRKIDEIIHHYSSNHRRSLKASKRKQLTVYYTDSKEDWLEYYNIYQGCVKRWGEQATNAYEIYIFEIINNLPTDLFKLWICRNENNIIAGALVFHFNKIAVYWHGATDADFYDSKPMHLLQTRIIETLATEGVRYYDFNPSGGHKGVIRFKKGFGAFKECSTILLHEGCFFKRAQEAHNYIKNVYRFFN
jgi:hypothetical protein